MSTAAALEIWRALPGVESVRNDDGLIGLTVREPHLTIPALLDAVARQGSQLLHLTTRQASLEDVFRASDRPPFEGGVMQNALFYGRPSQLSKRSETPECRMPVVCAIENIDFCWLGKGPGVQSGQCGAETNALSFALKGIILNARNPSNPTEWPLVWLCAPLGSASQGTPARTPKSSSGFFVFPMLLALGLGIAFRNKPADMTSIAIVSGPGAQEILALVQRSPQKSLIHAEVLDQAQALQGFRLGKYDLVVVPNTRENEKGKSPISLRSRAP